MLRLSEYVNEICRFLLRTLPLSEHQKTRLWATSLPKVKGRVEDWPYYRCVELAFRAIASTEGYGALLPGSGLRESKYSMLEFGVANGSSFQILLHFRDVWAKRLGVENQVIGIGFDTFEGLPAPREEDLVTPWRRGDYPADLENLQKYLELKFENFLMIKGLFSDTLKSNQQLLRDFPPVFVAIDCDYYSSTMDVLKELLPDVVPHGCLFYFDDVSINSWSDRTGELRAIAEVNAGSFGEHIQLVEYPLWIETREMRHYKQVYRLMNLETVEDQVRTQSLRPPEQALRHNRLSPL